MWLNHIDREERVRNQRRHKIDQNQQMIFTNPEKFGNNYNNINDLRKDKLINESLKDGYGNSLITEMSGCPIQKVHKLKQKKRDKLRKYLYSGIGRDSYEQDKYRLQNGNLVSIEMTPDYHFRRVLDPKKESYQDDILNQIKNNQYKRDYNKKVERDRDIMEHK